MSKSFVVVGGGITSVTIEQLFFFHPIAQIA